MEAVTHESCACDPHHDHHHDHRIGGCGCSEEEAERTILGVAASTVLLGSSLAFIVAGLIAEFAIAHEIAAVSLYTAAALLGLAFVAPPAWASLRRLTADMNVLMGIAVVGALFLGSYYLACGMEAVDTFRDAAVVIFLYQVGEWLEDWSRDKTRGSIQDLLELAPDTAHLVDGSGAILTVEASSLASGSLVRVLPGERVPADGVIVEGSSALDEAPVTGESVPRDKGVGDEVFGATLNTASPLTVRVSAPPAEGTVAKIVEMVEEAEDARAPFASFIDRFSAVYTPLVVLAALVVGLGVPLALLAAGVAFDWLSWVWRALTLLVIACPCALVISTPVAFVSAITRAARAGVLVKGGAYLDIASKVGVVAFDKTGTLTEGAPQVTVVTGEGTLALAAALEAESTHPLARAVVGAAEERGLALGRATSVEELSGRGMVGEVDGVRVLVGKPAFVEESLGTPLPAPASAAVAEATGSGATCLVVARASDASNRTSEVVGTIALKDTLRPQSAETIAHLGTRAVLLTGDNAATAASVGAELGIGEVRANLMPADKLDAVRSLQASGATVAMVGDGINDAPALTAADLGITLGAAASDTALEVSDVALLAGDISALPDLFCLGRRTMAIVRENIAFALGVKALVMVLAICGLAGMGAAIFADTGVTCLVVANSLRLMRVRLSAR